MNLVVVRQRPATFTGWLSAVAWALALLAIGFAIALPEPWIVVLGTAGAIAVVGTFVEPLLAIPLLMLAVPFGSVLRSAPEAALTATAAEATATNEPSVGAAEVLVALLLGAWLARGVARRQIRFQLSKTTLAILAMVCLAALSIGYSANQTLAVKESLKWLELLVMVFIVLDRVTDQRRALWVLGALFAAGAAEAAYGAYQFATGSGPDQFAVQGALRAFGHFDQPNPFAGYLTTILPLAVLMAATPGNPTLFRWYSLACSGAIAVGIGLSQSRGAWLGGLFAIVALVLMWSRTTRRLVVPGAIAATLAVVLAVSGLLPPAVLDRVAQTIEYFGVFDVRTVQVTSENWAVVERMAHWQAGWYMFLDHPWLGVGAGNYAEAYPAYFVGPWPEALGHAHNFYLNMLAELGVVGGALLLLILGLAVRHLGTSLLRSEDQQRTFWRAVLAGAVGSLVVFSVHNLFDSLFVHSVNVQIGVILGLGLTATRKLALAR